MVDCVDAFTDMCVRKGYVTVERAPWLRYALEKRVTFILISVPICILGIILAPPAMAISFCLSFYLLRVRTNGFHARSRIKCFILSLISVGIFLGLLPRVLNTTIEFTLLVFAATLICKLAPFNHPNMALTKEELTVCAHSAKRRLALLMTAAFLAHIVRFRHLATGIIEGIIMVTMSLVLAYFADWKHTKALI